MQFVFLSVCCSIIVAVLIKLARRRNINVQQLVLWNYPVTVLCTYLVLNPEIDKLIDLNLPYHLYIPLIILLPTLFIFIALAIKYSGIVKTDVAQRMSLFIPLLASFILFDEKLHINKGIGLGIGLLAVLCSISWGKEKSEISKDNKPAIYPLIVFIGMGIIDVLFKQIAQHKDIPYTTSMFIVFFGAMLFSFILLMLDVYVKKNKLDKRSIYWGFLLGGFNFANIFFYMKAHRSLPDNPSVVFTSMNIGVIVIGTIVGILLFKEKLSKINLIGLILAIISIIIITYL